MLNCGSPFLWMEFEKKSEKIITTRNNPYKNLRVIHELKDYILCFYLQNISCVILSYLSHDLVGPEQNYKLPKLVYLGQNGPKLVNSGQKGPKLDNFLIKD